MTARTAWRASSAGPVPAGPARVRLADLDAALRSSAAGRGLAAVVAELTGGPLRDRPAERDATRAGREQLWAELDRLLVTHGLAGRNWVQPWTDWLHRGGVLTRLPAAKAAPALAAATRALAKVLDDERPPAGIAELASEITGDAHGLDDGAPAAALVLRALAFALDVPARRVGGGPPPALAARRREHRRDLRHGDHLRPAATRR